MVDQAKFWRQSDNDQGLRDPIVLALLLGYRTLRPDPKIKEASCS
jgi:hypothetical protein